MITAVIIIVIIIFVAASTISELGFSLLSSSIVMRFVYQADVGRLWSFLSYCLLDSFAVLLAGLHSTTCLAALCWLPSHADCGRCVICERAADAPWFLLLIVCSTSRR